MSEEAQDPVIEPAAIATTAIAAEQKGCSFDAEEKGQKDSIDLTGCSLISLPASEAMLAETKPAEGTIFAQGSLVLFIHFVCRACCGDVRGR